MVIPSYLPELQAPEPEVSHVQTTSRNLTLLTCMGFLFTHEGI